MYRTDRKESIPAIQSLRIIHTGDTVFTGTSKRKMAVCSPRANVAYSFWLSWQWLKNKMRNKTSKSQS